MPYGQLTTLKLVCALRAYPPLDGLLDPDKVSSPFLFVSLSVSCIGFLVFALHLYPPLDGLCGFSVPAHCRLMRCSAPVSIPDTGSPKAAIPVRVLG